MADMSHATLKTRWSMIMGGMQRSLKLSSKQTTEIIQRAAQLILIALHTD
jgi:hypothetical protein